MDTDGTVDDNNQCFFTTSNLGIAKGFSELIRSLGMKARYVMRHPKLEYRGETVVCKPAWQFYMTCREFPPFRTRPGRTKLYVITSVNSIPTIPVRCIEVDSPSHLYLAGEGMVPTHNTTQQLKVAIFERMRDFVSNGMLRVRSMATLEEMRTISREGDSIEAQGSAKDDRVFAMALAVRNWDERVRRKLINERRTRQNEESKRRLNIRDQVNLFNSSQFESYLAGKGVVRRRALMAMRRQGWRG
jgi:hypothetical protein